MNHTPDRGRPYSVRGNPPAEKRCQRRSSDDVQYYTLTDDNPLGPYSDEDDPGTTEGDEEPDSDVFATGEKEVQGGGGARVGRR